MTRSLGGMSRWRRRGRAAAVAAAACIVLLAGQPVIAGPDDPPTWPIGAEITVGNVTATTADLSWTAAVDEVGVAGYRVYDGGVEIASSVGPSVQLTGLDPETEYDVRVEAFDADGNESDPSGGFELLPRTDLYAGVNAHSIKGEDVDGDGVPDLVAAVTNSDGIAVFLGYGDGTFEAPVIYRSSSPGAGDVGPKNAVVADVDGDSVVDLVTANQNDDSIGILLGNGDGTFAQATAIGTCNGTHDVAVGFFDADADLDAAAVCWGANTMTRWLGNGDGTFADRVDIANGEPASCVATSTCAHGIGVADLGGSSAQDVAIGAYGGVSANVLLGTGTGTFGAPAEYEASGNPHDIAIADFDDDGNPDLVTADESSNQISVFLGTASGTYGDPDTYPATYEPKGVTTGDLNGDGALDIAVASAGRNYPVTTEPGGDLITVWLGDGDGTFSDGGQYGDYTNPESSFDVSIGDLNGDGVGDLAASNWHSGNISIFFGASSGGPTTTFTTGEADVPVAVDDGPFVVVGGGSLSKAAPGVLVNDSVGDGSSMTAVKVSDPVHGSVLLAADGSFVYTHGGDAAVSDSFTYRVKNDLGDESNVATVSLTIGAVAGPVHEVGLVDPLSGQWYLFDDAGVLTSQFYFGNPGDYPFMGDWDGDGVETPGLYRQSDGYVYLRNTNTVGIADIKFFFGDPGDVPVAGDFNNDGFDTVSIYRPSNQTFYIINKLGSNDGGLGAAEFSYVFGNPGDKPFVGDFDGDGVETVGLHRESTGLVYFRNSHTQGNADAQFIFGDPGDRLIAGDWTGDGVFTPALFRPSNTTMYFRYTNSQGNADNQYVPTPTNPAWLPISGLW